MTDDKSKMGPWIDVVVLGGGPAGMCAALEAQRSGARRVVLFEKMPKLGTKLLLTGAGRCNLSNAKLGRSSYPGYGRVPHLKTLLEEWSLSRLEQFFLSLGVPLDRETDGRVYPRTRRAATVRRLLVRALEEAGVSLVTASRVRDIRPYDGGYIVEVLGEQHRAKRLIVALGGKGYPSTGSTGKGFELLEKLGVAIKEPRPVLVPLEARLGLLHKAQGQKWPCELILRHGRRNLSTVSGDVLITSYGLSGSAVLDLTAKVARKDYAGCVVGLNFFPGYDKETLLALIGERRQSLGEQLSTGELLIGLVPERFIEVLEELWLRDGDSRAAEVLTNYEVTLTSTVGWPHAQVTAGGVSLDEVEPETFELKSHSRLYAVGEMLALHGISGGYNLHVAIASGMTAGHHAGTQSRRK